MPLEQSASDEARSRNIATEIRAGKPAKQAAAIAYRVQRDNKSVPTEVRGRPNQKVRTREIEIPEETPFPEPPFDHANAIDISQNHPSPNHQGKDMDMDEEVKSFGEKEEREEEFPEDQQTKYDEQESLEDEEPREMPQQEEIDEPYGAQILRRVHGDYSKLFGEYDGFLRHLEHPHVGSFMKDLMKNKDRSLSMMEKLMKRHYKDLPPLEGTEEPGQEDLDEVGEEDTDPTPEGDEVEEEVVAEGPEGTGEEFGGDYGDEPPEEEFAGDDPMEADSTREEVPTPEEVVEGMKRGRGEMGEEGQKGVSSDQRHAINREDDAIAAGAKRRARRSGESPEYERRNMASSDTDIWKRDQLRQASGEGSSESNMKSMSCGKDMPCHSLLEPHEMGHLREAHSFLEELSNAQDFGDEHRMKSYHFHKCLSCVGGMVGTKNQDPNKERRRKFPGIRQGSPDADREAGKYVEAVERHWGEDPEARQQINRDDPPELQGKALIVGDEDWLREEQDEHEHMKSAISGVSDFFKALSVEKAFGEPHRQRALFHHKALEPFVSSDDREEDEIKEDQEDEYRDQEEGQQEGEYPDDSEDYFAEEEDPLDEEAEEEFEPGEMGQKGSGPNRVDNPNHALGVPRPDPLPYDPSEGDEEDYRDKVAWGLREGTSISGRNDEHEQGFHDRAYDMNAQEPKPVTTPPKQGRTTRGQDRASSNAGARGGQYHGTPAKKPEIPTYPEPSSRKLRRGKAMDEPRKDEVEVQKEHERRKANAKLTASEAGAYQDAQRSRNAARLSQASQQTGAKAVNSNQPPSEGQRRRPMTDEEYSVAPYTAHDTVVPDEGYDNTRSKPPIRRYYAVSEEHNRSHEQRVNPVRGGYSRAPVQGTEGAHVPRTHDNRKSLEEAAAEQQSRLDALAKTLESLAAKLS